MHISRKSSVSTPTIKHRLAPPQAVVQLILQQDKRILLGLRQHTGLYDQHWSLPCGRVEALESMEQALYREALEELGIELQQASLVAQRPDRFSNQHFIYIATQWRGQLGNQEPRLCHQLQWFNYQALPITSAPITLWAANLIPS